MYDSVSRTAKDHIQKLMADVFQNTLPDWYGLSDLKIIASVPSDVPLLQVHDRLLDRVFVTDNGELLHLEFQSQIENNLYRFLAYASALALYHHRPIRTVVIYLTSMPSAPTELNLRSLQYTVENIVIGDKHGPTVWQRLTAREPTQWTDADILDLAFYPFMNDSRSPSERALIAAELAGTLPGSRGRLAAAIIVGLTTSFVDPDVLKLMKEVLQMNDLISELEREAIERGWEKGHALGLKQGLKQGLEQGLEQGRNQGVRQGQLNMVQAILATRLPAVAPEFLEIISVLDDRQLIALMLKVASITSQEELRQALESVN